MHDIVNFSILVSNLSFPEAAVIVRKKLDSCVITEMFEVRINRQAFVVAISFSKPLVSSFCFWLKDMFTLAT